jgi:phosphate-selective porin OprO/OprP
MLTQWTGRLAWRRRVLRASSLSLTALGLVAVGLLPRTARAQAPAVTTEATLDSTSDAGEADAVEPKRKLVKWNEYDGPLSTLRVGYGFLIDFSTFSQDQASKQQVSMSPDAGVRDFRLLFKGRFKTKRAVTWTVGYMYDGAAASWVFRQTGIQVAIPELEGRVFIGRTKEGFSMNKVMTGYHPWMIERTFMLDAFVPILADGVKWMGYLPRNRLYFSVGWFGDLISENEKFSTYDHQVVARVVWQPILSEGGHKVLHVGIMSRDSRPDGGKFQARSRPEDYLTPYFLDTGKFASDHANTAGVEAYYRSGSWFYGSEYDWQNMDASTGEHPLFHGGTAVVAWLVTGETRGYNAPGAFFDPVSPAKPVFQGGPGAWEAVLNYSYADFDDGSFHGGKLWRLTPMVNWHMSDNVRLELAYGVSMLDRFGVKGRTQFYQARIQTSL